MTSEKDDQQEKQHSIESVGENPASGSNLGQASVENAGLADQPEPPLSTFIHLGGDPPIKPDKVKRGTIFVCKKVTVVSPVVSFPSQLLAHKTPTS
jgi:hypothetical protein